MIQHGLRKSLDERVLPFDLRAAEICAELRAHVRASGRSIGTADSYIAAIAAANGLIVASRDTQPFEAAGVPVINPLENCVTDEPKTAAHV